MNGRSIRRGFSSFFLIAGALILTACALQVTRAHLYQVRESRRFASEVKSGALINPPSLSTKPRQVAATVPKLQKDAILGELKIPRLGVDTLVFEGADTATMRWGAGHIPYTATPDNPHGNVGIAAHRDTYFRPLRNIRANDIIILQTLGGVYRYRVQSTKIVAPDDVDVLDDNGQPALTLVTCYPFHYLGSAPNRFIVRAVVIPPKMSDRPIS
jgi:sortase A